MLRKVVLSCLLILLLANISLAKAQSDLFIDGDKVNFDIAPQDFTNDTLVPLDLIDNLARLKIVELSEDKVLFHHQGEYILLNIGERSVQISNRKDDLLLSKSPIKVNGHLLVPVDFLRNVLKIKGVFAERPREKDKNNNFAVVLEVENTKVYQGKSYDVKLSLKNKSNKAKALKFNTGQHYDFIIKSKKGEIVYQWSADKFFTQAFNTVILKANETKVYKSKIIIPKGLNSGNYKLYGKITTNSEILAEPIDLIVRGF